MCIAACELRGSICSTLVCRPELLHWRAWLRTHLEGADQHKLGRVRGPPQCHRSSQHQRQHHRQLDGHGKSCALLRLHLRLANGGLHATAAGRQSPAARFTPWQQSSDATLFGQSPKVVKMLRAHHKMVHHRVCSASTLPALLHTWSSRHPQVQ